MTPHGWLGILLYVLLTTATGHLAITYSRFKHSGLVNSWSVYYLSGQLILTTATISTAFLPWRLPHIKYLLVVLISIYWASATLRRRESVQQVALAAAKWGGVILGIVLLFPDIFVLVNDVPLRDWDARSTWMFHGKVIFTCGRIDTTFLTDPLYAWCGRDYPILIPAQSAWSSLFVGEWNDYACKAFLIFNFCAYIHLFFLMLREKNYPWWLALAVAVFVFDQESYSYVNGYADNHYAIALVLALFLLSAPTRAEHIPLFVLLPAFAANIKNESRMYVILVLAAAFAVGVFSQFKQRWRNTRRLVRQYGNLAVFACLLGIAPIVLWEAVKSIYNLENVLELVPQMASVESYTGVLSDRFLPIARYMIEYYTNKHVPYVILLLLLTTLWRSFLARARGVGYCGIRAFDVAGWTAMVVVNGLIFAAFLVTPLDLAFNLGTAAGRLLFLPFMIACLLCIHNIEVLWVALPSCIRIRDSVRN